jgi:two-component system nitrogen regulation response regulator GlnG
MASLDETTRRASPPDRRERAPRRLLLTIAMHPSLRRVGERAGLHGIDDGGRVALSRSAPEFRTVDGRPCGPLADPFISRSPLVLRAGEGGDIILERDANSSALTVDGVAQQGRLVLSAEALRRGVILELAYRVVLVLHSVAGPEEPLPKYGLIGESAEVQRVRREIAESAGLNIPVLIRGESGTGKELVARAIHTASSRAAQPYVVINMAALNPHTAVAELFGHARGSFTGAVQTREGYFRAANGGTLFLDEIGEAPVEIQAMLLRVLESGEVQPVGGAAARRVDVRVIAATDADLEEQVHHGGFRPSLLHRLSGYPLAMPTLARRRDDIPRLLLHFLERELQQAGQPERFERLVQDAATQLPSRLMVQALLHEWPGNVRQLNNFARRLAAALLAERDPASLAALLAEGPASPPDEGPGPPPPVAVADADAEGASELSDDALIEAMRSNGWQIAATARALGISRNTLYARMRRSGQIRKARDIPRGELAELYRRHDGDLAAIARSLDVSPRGLQLRLRELELIT